MLTPKREAVNVILNPVNKTASANVYASNEPMGSLQCHNFMTVTPSYHSKVTPIGEVHAEKLDGVGPVDNRPSTD